MTTFTSRLVATLFASRARAVTLVLTVVGLGFGAVSCRTVNRVTVMLPDVPGAKYIGSKECEQCHEKIYKDFQTADHSLLVMGGPNALNAGCESCHGPSSLHSDSGGEVKPPYSFSAGRPIANDSGANRSTPVARSVDTVCYTCHAEVRGQFGLPSHHPVPEGHMSCTACHSPHKGFAHVGGSTALRAQDENCLQCHPAQRGPFVFEHEAMREGCTACHGAHGTVNAKLLTVRDANLCMKCHFQQVQGGQILIGGHDHSAALVQGTCWTAGCHEAVHGSRVNSSLRF
ncbi:MAG TPA: cytochrome c3 family protein [Verrucomicrobiae bacterium]|nr:cytochrome c3 family protein [Verrucomicrobiae bacterium]